MRIAKTKQTLLIALLLATQTGCSVLYYKAMEHLGKQKRDILVSRILSAKKDQQATKQQLKTTLQAFQEVTGFKGGNLEKVYNKLHGEYDRCEDRANKLKSRVDSIDQVANDLFSEWQREISGMHDQSLKSQSAELLRTARLRHAQYMKQMRRTENSIHPVLQEFSDQVVFLKHNLNARAIQSIKGTSTKINAQAAVLMRDIDASSKQADDLIQALSKAG